MNPLADMQGYASLAATGRAQAQVDAAQRVDPASAKGAHEAAQAFESYFVEAMLKEMRRTVPKTEEGQGQAMDIFQGLFDGAIAERIAQGHGIGLADMIEKSLNRSMPHGRGGVDASGVDAAGGEALLDMGRISSAFGMRKDPFTGELRRHEGLDIALPEGTPVRPIRPGRVIFSGVQGGYGEVVVVDHGQGLKSTYAHLKDRSVKEGDLLDIDEGLGHVGSTGRSTGPHLHLEVSRDGRAMDPAEYLDR